MLRILELALPIRDLRRRWRSSIRKLSEKERGLRRVRLPSWLISFEAPMCVGYRGFIRVGAAARTGLSFPISNSQSNSYNQQISRSSGNRKEY